MGDGGSLIAARCDKTPGHQRKFEGRCRIEKELGLENYME